MTSFTPAELKRIAKSLKSNPETVQRWEKTLGLQGMTPSAAVAAIRDAKLSLSPTRLVPAWLATC